jgi:hypothetical protein
MNYGQREESVRPLWASLTLATTEQCIKRPESRAIPFASRHIRVEESYNFRVLRLDRKGYGGS